MRAVRSADLIRDLVAAGWVLDRVRRSHRVLKHGAVRGRSSCRIRRKQLGVGLVAAIRRQAGPERRKIMRYPIAIEPGGDDTAFGVVCAGPPPGSFCRRYGSTKPWRVPRKRWLRGWRYLGFRRRDSGASLDVIRGNPDYQGWTFAIVSVDPVLLDDTIEKGDITLPRRVLKRLDARARAAGESRFDHIATLTLK